jgi:vacuolar-type H+-ATPase subunit E/Vma4
MEDSTKEDIKTIVSTILAEAEAEAKKIIDAANDYAQNSGIYSSAQAQNILEEARNKAQRQAAHIMADIETKIIIEKRKISLRIQEDYSKEVLSKVFETISGLMRQAGYNKVLLFLIVEAGIGLSVDSATVNASMDELPLINDELLREAEKQIKAASGKSIRLQKMENDPLPSQGIYLVSHDKRLAFDNKISSRMGRYMSEIRMLIHKRLIEAGN